MCKISAHVNVTLKFSLEYNNLLRLVLIRHMAIATLKAEIYIVTRNISDVAMSMHT